MAYSTQQHCSRLGLPSLEVLSQQIELLQDPKDNIIGTYEEGVG